MNITDAEQRKLILLARDGDLEARDKLLLFHYGKTKELLVSLDVPEDYHNDIMQDCVISFIDAINNRSVESTQTINCMMYCIVIACAKRFLKKLYIYNGKFDTPECSIAAEGVYPTNIRVLKELLENGIYNEEVIMDEGTSLRATEDEVIDGFIIDEYWRFVERQTPQQQDIIVGRIPIDDCYEESGRYYAQKYNCKSNNIMNITESAKKRMRCCKIMGYLKK